MRLLIVNLHLDIGGVETLLVRLIPQLARRGVSVTLLLLQKKVNKEFYDSLITHCDVKFAADAFPFTKKHLQAFFGGQPDVAYFTINQAFVLGTWLLTRAGYSTKTVLGAYQTEIFCAEAKPWQYHRRLVQNAIRNRIPASSMIFGNTAGRDFHADKLKVSFNASPIVRLFVDIEKYKFIDRSQLPRIEIVSIGRISPYKTYNFTILPIVSRFVASGHSLKWHIYGDGEDYDKLRNTVDAMGLSDHVHLHGAMSYSRFQQVLDNAFLFVGSGTSLIEAAACGVPALTTIEYAEDAISYGFISEIQGFNLIEPGLDKKVFAIEEKILETLALDTESYTQLQHECYRKANSYSGDSVVDEYINVFHAARKTGTAVRLNSFQMMLYCASAALGYAMKKLGLHH